jgi:RND family efflux transporter MFP subunit
MIAAASDPIVGRDFPGIVRAQNRADLSFRVSGKLRSMNIKEGQEVIKGEVLAQLDQTDYKITLEDKRANFEEAKANFERSAKLLEPGHISQREFDQIKASYSTATAQLKSAEQDLLYTTLKAPFDGSITKIHIENFEEVVGKETIATLQDLTSLEIEIDIPESIMIRVKRGETTREIFAIFEAIEDKRFPLTVREVSAQADETTRAYKVRLRMPPIEDYVILPGMTATVIADEVRTSNNGEDSNIIIPSHAVLEDNKGRFVYVAVPEGDENRTATVHRRTVETSKLTSDGLIITSGIEPDEHVIIAGMSKMHEGLQVRLMAGSEH